jgi:iron-sulfur cluster assembly protein
MNITETAWDHIKTMKIPLIPEIGLRIGIRGGGCSGLSYAFQIDILKENDHIFSKDNHNVFVDPKSFVFLEEVTLDYEKTLMHSGFTFINPKAVKSCGCGTSFSV